MTLFVCVIAYQHQIPSRPGSNRGVSRGQGYDMERVDRSVTIKTPGQEADMERGGEERIEVQVWRNVERKVRF